MRLPVLLVPWVLVGAVLPRDAAAQTPFTRLVSTHAGVGGAGHAQRAEMSAEGRFVVFESAAADHVPGDVNGQGDVFLTDDVVKRLRAILAGENLIGHESENLKPET